MKRLKYFTMGGILFVLITGSLAHFLYDWSGNNLIIGLFSPVSESIWEHMKLIFFPMLIYSLSVIPGLRSETNFLSDGSLLLLHVFFMPEYLPLYCVFSVSWQSDRNAAHPCLFLCLLYYFRQRRLYFRYYYLLFKHPHRLLYCL